MNRRVAGSSSSGAALLAVELGAFGSFGLFWGSFAVLLTDLSRALDLSPGPLGLALFVGATASILCMALLGWTADRLGRRPFLVASSGMFGLGSLGLAFVETYAALLATLIVLYAASGLYDVGINAVAVDLERMTGRRFMAVLHAAFSAGAVAGALSAGALLSLGVDYRHIYLGVLLPLGAVIPAVAATRFPRVEARRERGEEKERSGLHRNGSLILVAVIAALALLSEGEMEHWSGIYLRRTLELPALIGASGVAVFYGAMAAGRLGAALAITRFGNRRTLLGAGLLTAGGMVLALATRQPWLVIGGFLLVGLALSAIVPIAFSVAGNLAPERAGTAVSVVTTLGYGGFLLGPALVGNLAELVGLRLALGVVAVAGLLIWTIGLCLKSTDRRGVSRDTSKALLTREYR